MMLPTLQATKLRPGFIPVSVYRLRTVNTTKITTEPVSTAHLPGKFFQARVTAPVAMSEAAPALFQFVLHSIFNGLHRRQFTGSILRERERERESHPFRGNWQRAAHRCTGCARKGRGGSAVGREGGGEGVGFPFEAHLDVGKRGGGRRREAGGGTAPLHFPEKQHAVETPRPRPSEG